MTKSKRDREYSTFSPQERAEVVYEYLFKGRSHRWLDAHILEQDSEVSRGWQSMGILHHLGLVNVHKSLFKNSDVEGTLHLLEQLDANEYAEIIK